MPLTRRALVSASVLGVSALAPGLGVAAATADPSRRVLVVGAGIAGIAAARSLADQGYAVTVLEARDRIGGRIHTSRIWPDLPVELGASWIHERDGNPLTAVATQAGLTMVSTDYDSAVTYDARLGRIPTGAGSAYDRMLRRIEAGIRRGYALPRDTALRGHLERSIGLATLDEAQQRLANHHIVSLADDEFAGDSAQLSAWYWDSMGGFEGLDVVLPHGYDRLVGYLADGLDIRLGAVVRRVDRLANGVRVHTDDEVIAAARVIVTVPLGVLKHAAIEFHPALPPRKRAAVRALGMGSGTLTKVWLRFPDTFWDTTDWIEHVADADERGRFHQWLNASRLTGQPLVCGFLGGAYAARAETWTDARIVAEAMEVLRTMYGARIPDPVGWQIPRWSRDPFSYGSYSFNALGSRPQMRNDLAGPIAGRVFFAGEATHRSLFATAHGAYLSGLRAARQVRAVDE
jgi:monoamine oxidase